MQNKLNSINKDEYLEETKKKIYRNISEIGFENTAQQYSISDSSKIGGKIGVIAENKLSKKIKDELKNMKINILLLIT